MSKHTWNPDGDLSESAVRARRRARKLLAQVGPQPRVRWRRRMTVTVIAGFVLAIAITLVSVELGVRAGTDGMTARFEGTRRYFAPAAWRRAHAPKKQTRPVETKPANGGVG